jgi:predicted nucleic acid-binding protein
VIIVDTDALSHIKMKNSVGIVIESMLEIASDPVIRTTSVNAYEMLSGTLSLIERRKKERGDLIAAFSLLEGLLDFLGSWKGHILPYDAKAEQIYKGLSPRLRQELKDDARIASVALSNNAAVWTCNVTDYLRVPGLSVVDARTGLKVSSN